MAIITPRKSSERVRAESDAAAQERRRPPADLDPAPADGVQRDTRAGTGRTKRRPRGGGGDQAAEGPGGRRDRGRDTDRKRKDGQGGHDGQVPSAKCENEWSQLINSRRYFALWFTLSLTSIDQ